MTRLALICTQGFADVLTLGRQSRADPYALHVGESPWRAALPDAWRLEVPGRIDAAGREVEPLVLTSLARQLAQLPEPPLQVAVCLLFAQRNPVHEQQLRTALQTMLPGVPVTCSHALASDSGHGGEYEHMVATVRAAGLSLPAAAAPHEAPAAAGLPALAHALEALADDMQACLVAQAVSSVVREAMDCAAAVFLPDGRMLAQARSLPLLLGSLAPAVAGLLAQFPASAMRPGDGYLSNDPWAGGTHLPDFVLLRPVHVDGVVRALVACILHHQDVGGSTPGSVPTDATSVQQEGLRIPPVALYREGEPDTALMRLLCANSRMPDNLAGDLAAQWAALQSGAAALQLLITQRGAAFEPAADALINSGAEATRAALRSAPDGEWHFADQLDGDGISPAPVGINVVLRKRGDAMEMDLRGCAAQTRGPVNASRGAVWAAVSYFARMLAPQAASNHGCTAPFTLLTRTATVVDPAFPAAVNARTNLVKLLANALLGAWAQAVPGHMPAPNAGVAAVLSLSGEVPGGRAAAQRWMFTEIIASAAGGAPWGAGGSGVSTDVGNARNTPAEVIEAQAPLRVERIAVRHGSGGAGAHAGGCGVVRSYRLLAGSGLISYRGERHATAAQGAAGGAPGACGTARIERADGRIETLPAKARVQWQAGDRLVIETAGGGGWGNPAGTGAEFA